MRWLPARVWYPALAERGVITARFPAVKRERVRYPARKRILTARQLPHSQPDPGACRAPPPLPPAAVTVRSSWRDPNEDTVAAPLDRACTAVAV
jgi:hypothetical protein